MLHLHTIACRCLCRFNHPEQGLNYDHQDYFKPAMVFEGEDDWVLGGDKGAIPDRINHIL